MSILAETIAAVEGHEKFVQGQVERARADSKFGAELAERAKTAAAQQGQVTTPTGISVPRLPLPSLDDSAALAKYLFGEGLPGEFPFMNAAYPHMYQHDPQGSGAEEPTRLFAGLGLAEDTNRRFHFIAARQ